jgi:hypothetical protein
VGGHRNRQEGTVTPLDIRNHCMPLHKLRRTAMLKCCRFFLVGGIIVAFVATGAANAAPDACKATTSDAFDSCKSGAHSDKSLARGKCDNVPDAAARKTCVQQAASDLKDTLQTCSVMRDFRNAACTKLGPAPYSPVIDPAHFATSTTIDNPFMPLLPGTTFIYEGQTAQGLEHNEIFVTQNTKVLDGVTCVEVLDTVKINGEPEEQTLDWFAQDTDGNVWYFGENSEQLAGSLVVSLDGSFMAGVDGAAPGIVMKAHPAVGDFYRQEFDLDNAEDLAGVISLNESVTVAAGSFDHCLETEETEAIDPSALEHKFYAAGTGNVLVLDLVTGERLELLRVTH